MARTRYGFRIAGDQRLIMPRCIYWFGHWEPPLSTWIRSALRPGDVFVDVGANAGYYTLLAARAVAPGGWVVAVEASPETAVVLQENLARNRVANVRVVQAAAAEREGRMPFFRAPWNDAESTTVRGERHEPAGEVPALPLAQILTDDELARSRVIKVDVEGGELAVLQGLAPAAGALRPEAELAVEAHPDVLARIGASVADVVAALEPAGFSPRELPVDISEAAHLFPAHPATGPLGEGAGLRHLVLSRSARRSRPH